MPEPKSVIQQAQNALKTGQSVGVEKISPILEGKELEDKLAVLEEKSKEIERLQNGLKELPKVTITQEYNASGGHKLMVEVEGHGPVYSPWAAYDTLATISHPATGQLYVGATEFYKGTLPPVFIVQEVKGYNRRRLD